MDKNELRKRYGELDGAGRALMMEKLVFCRFADDYDFENYFRIEELGESDLLCLVSFLYHQECYLMIRDILNRYPDRFAFEEASLLEETMLDEGLLERIARIGL